MREKNVLILGSGGREHAMAAAILPSYRRVFVLPGNPGMTLTKSISIIPEVGVGDFKTIGEVCRKKEITMIVVGPEAPLADGIVDYFKSDENLTHIEVIGPTSYAAILEASKKFSKDFMFTYGIPTANFKTFNKDEFDLALNYAQGMGVPIVIKASGLALGKGVVICDSHKDAEYQIASIFGGAFGDAGNEIVVEEFLDGRELSVFAAVDGKGNYLLLPTAKDYKRIGDGDTGPNTGGMGAIAPVPYATDDLMQTIRKKIVEPTIKGMKDLCMPYTGFLYIGLMIKNGEPYVLEYNCRLGDPETQAVLPLIGNFAEVLEGVASDALDAVTLEVHSGYSAAVVLASKGYPGAIAKGRRITFQEEALSSPSSISIFFAGVAKNGSDLVTSGGRVLALQTTAKTIDGATSILYENIDIAGFEDSVCRKDIGQDVLAMAETVM